MRAATCPSIGWAGASNRNSGLWKPMTLDPEAVVTKIMWILSGQTKDPARIRRMFLRDQ